MLIAGTIVVLFIMGLFFSMIGSRPSTESEQSWERPARQNDTPAGLEATTADLSDGVPAVRA